MATPIDYSYLERTHYDPTTGAYTGFGGGGAPFVGRGGGIMGAYGTRAGGGLGGPGDLFERQRAENERARAENEAKWAAARDYLLGVGTRAQADPLMQAARGQALGLAQSPEALSDITQQKIINRATNLQNALMDARRQKLRGELAGRGLLGSTAERAGLDRLERERMAQLMGTTTELEIQRAARRNEDIERATRLAAALAGQQSALEAQLAGTYIGGLPLQGPEDYSGLGALLASQARGGAAGFGGMAGGFAPGYTRRAKPESYLGDPGTGWRWTAPGPESFWPLYGPYSAGGSAYDQSPYYQGGYQYRTPPPMPTGGEIDWSKEPIGIRPRP
jgi:hypothetical protein